MQDLGIEYSGASTFFKYGYIVRDRGEWEPKYADDPKTEHSPEPYWHPDPHSDPIPWTPAAHYSDPCPHATKAPPHRLNTTYIDPQAPEL